MKPSGMNEEAANLGRATASAVYDELCRSAAELMDCEVAVFTYSVGGVKRMLGSHGVASRYRSYEVDFGQTQYAKGDKLVISEVKPGGEISAIASRLGVTTCGFFMREPVLATEKITASLMVFGASPHPKPSRSQQASLAGLVKLFRKELALRRADLEDPDAHVTVTGTLADIRREVEHSTEPKVLLDDKLTILAVSASLAAILGRKPKNLVGHKHGDIGVASSEAIAWLYAHALQTRVSPPEFEVVSESKDGNRNVFRVSVAPLSPTDTEKYFLYVTVHDVTDFLAQSQRLATRIGKESKVSQKAPKEPSMLFLLETLVPRRVIHERKDVSYLTLASWRQSIRNYQIEALKALKQNIPPELPAAIAASMAREINNLVGASAFRAVVPMPCSHSSSDSCLSREIARALAATLNLPVVPALAAAMQKGASHPKKNVRRPPMKLVEKVPGPVILVDDVATSGAHVEEAVKLLKPACGAVLAVVWISGDKV